MVMIESGGTEEAPMAGDGDTLLALVREVSRQSELIQNLIRDYSLDVMGDAG